MPETWSNWSGSLQFRPDRLEVPEDEQALCTLMAQAAAQGRGVRVVGAGHSSSPLVETRDILVSLEKFQGVLAHDQQRCEATVGAGTTVHDAGKAFLQLGLATHNTGDVDVQTLAGAISTGTHGTGKELQNLSAMLIGGRLVTAQGEVVEYDIARQPDSLRAARVALGTLGIFTTLRVGLLPAFTLRRREWCAETDPSLAHLDELIDQNRNFDFYWYPRNDIVKLRTLNLADEPHPDIPFATCVADKEGWSAEVLPRERTLKFDEMEYAIAAEAGPACFQEVRQRIIQKHRKDVAWRVLYRTVAGDDSWLSPAFGRDTVTISLHHNAGLPFDAYFNDIEPIFRAYGGRPHWGKKHNLKAQQLRSLYPMWDQFAEARQQLDPQGVLLTPYLRDLLIVQ
jgi:FAD/FMN-containing dehydrogenase